MSHRHDDELPSLTPAQQAEAIRLAARLQAEHEETSTASLFQAAEEVGIDRRFLEKAVAQIADPSDVTAGLAESHVEPPSARVSGRLIAAGLALILLSGTIAFWGDGVWRLPFLLVAGLGFGFSAERHARRAWTPSTIVLAGWLGMAFVFALYSQARTGNTGMIDGRFFIAATIDQTVAALLGSLMGRLTRLPPHRAQSL